MGEAAISGTLWDLTKALAERGVEISGGVLGGEFGYGGEFSNDIFEMHPYWWGDCECGYERREAEYEVEHPHAPECYHSVLWGGFEANGFKHRVDPSELARQWGLPQFGCAVHCTCGQDERYAAWRETHDHSPACPTVRPNFRHKPSGSEVRWYKYIGRSLEVDLKAPWHVIASDCFESLVSS